jgi:hypothetical protein
MPTIKIVPMPGVSVPGPQGPAGQTGPAGSDGADGAKGAGFEPVTLFQNGPLGFFFNPDEEISKAWDFATNVRVSSFSNRDKYIEGYIVSINHEAGTVSVDVQYDFTNGDYIDHWVMELTGARGADADTGNFQFDGNIMSTDEDMTITVNGVPGKVNIGGYLGVDLQFANTPGAGLKFPDDTVQTTAYTGPQELVFPQPVSWTPEVSGTGFTQTSNPATGTYLKYGSMVVVNIFVPFSNVTNFGSGQYSVTLPFPAKNHVDVFAGSIHNTGPSTDHYSLKGHLADESSSMSLWYISGASRDEPFDHNSPITLNTTDLFHMHFIYEIQE